MNEIRITPTPQYMGYGYELRILKYKESQHDTAAFAQSITMQSVEDKAVEIPSIMTLTKIEVQKWLDELWALGIRPSNGEGNIGEIGAVKYHLEDMRKLVFKEKK